jgi:hypothetical protein
MPQAGRDKQLTTMYVAAVNAAVIINQKCKSFKEEIP